MAIERIGDLVDMVIADRFENVLTKGRIALSEHQYTLSFGQWIRSEPFAEWRTQSLTLLGVVFDSQHVYTQNFDHVTTVDTTKQELPRPDQVEAGLGILQAASNDYDRGYTWTFKEIVHAEVFDEFLEQADYLVADGGYKDAAAVIAGSTLEEHVRKLCQKHGIATQIQGRRGMEPKRASVMNDELVKHPAYNQIAWRKVQGWLDIRNNAAHGNYNEYTQQDVEQMIDGIRDFIDRHPA